MHRRPLESNGLHHAEESTPVPRSHWDPKLYFRAGDPEAEYHKGHVKASHGKATLDITTCNRPGHSKGQRKKDANTPIPEQNHPVHSFDKMHSPPNGAALDRTGLQSLTELLRLMSVISMPHENGGSWSRRKVIEERRSGLIQTHLYRILVYPSDRNGS